MRDTPRPPLKGGEEKNEWMRDTPQPPLKGGEKGMKGGKVKDGKMIENQEIGEE